MKQNSSRKTIHQRAALLIIVVSAALLCRCCLAFTAPLHSATSSTSLGIRHESWQQKKTQPRRPSSRMGRLYVSQIKEVVVTKKEAAAAAAALLDESPPSAPSSSFSEQFQRKQPALIASSSVSADSPPQEDAETVYRKGLATIAFITVLFASNSPALHAAYVEVAQQPPVFLLNAAVSVVACAGMLLTGPLLDRAVDKPSLLQNDQQQDGSAFEAATEAPNRSAINNFLVFFVGQDTSKKLTLQAGMELGLWKFLGTLANLYGLSMTSADHGAFLIQLTTLFVPLAQGIMGVPIPARIWSAIGLALAGVFMFTQDPTGSAATLRGDLACVAAAVFYATYDLRLFHWGKRVEPLDLITTKIVTQTTLSLAVLGALALPESLDFLQAASFRDLAFVGAVTLWSGLAVNAAAPYLQVGGQQAVGPARAQVLYASQPLWAAVLSLVFLGETVGTQGLLGGSAFLAAMMLAATSEVPDPNCGKDLCET